MSGNFYKVVSQDRLETEVIVIQYLPLWRISTSWGDKEQFCGKISWSVRNGVLPIFRPWVNFESTEWYRAIHSNLTTRKKQFPHRRWIWQWSFLSFDIFQRVPKLRTMCGHTDVFVLIVMAFCVIDLEPTGPTWNNQFLFQLLMNESGLFFPF